MPASGLVHQITQSLLEDERVSLMDFVRRLVGSKPKLAARKPVAQSEKMPVPPRGSLAFSVEEIIAQGEWHVGSIEVSYTGPGKGRLFGTARQVDLEPVPMSEALPLVQAGFSVSNEKPQPQNGRHRPAF